MKKMMIATIILIFFIAGCTSMDSNKQQTSQIKTDGYITTLEGTYEASPMGPRVAGMMLIEMGVDDSLVGKTVRVTGNVYEFHEFLCQPDPRIPKAEQCFDGPIMKNVKLTIIK